LTDPAAPSLTDRLTMTREAIRASMVEASPKGPAAALEAILLRFLDALLRLLADFKAGRLAALPPGDAASAGAEEAAGRSCPAPGALDAPVARRGGMLARAWGLVWPRAFGVGRAVAAGGAASAATGGGVADDVEADRSGRRPDRRVTPGDHASNLVRQAISSPAGSDGRTSSNSGRADHGGARACRTMAPEQAAGVDVFTPYPPAARVPPAPARGSGTQPTAAPARGARGLRRRPHSRTAAASRLRDFWRPGGAFFQKSVLATGETGGPIVPW